MVKWILLLATTTVLGACAKSGGAAPSSAFSISILPTSLIVPKSISTNIQVLKADTLLGSSDVTSQAICTTNNPIATVSASGQVSNTYTGTQIQLVQVTCRYNDQTITIRMTIVPATLQSLVLTKTALTMGPSQSQSIQVYGNFIDSLNYVFALDMTNYVTWASTAAGVAGAVGGTVSSVGTGTSTLTASFATRSVATGVTVTNGAQAAAVPHGVG